MPLTICIAILAFALGFSAPAHADLDWNKVEQVFGREATEQPGGIHRFSFPRSDLAVTLDGIAVKPALALGSWLAFRPMGNIAMVMGDLVLTEDEVNPVMKRLAEGDIEIIALHNHLLRAEPAVMYMHVLGHGDPVMLAETLRAGIALSKTPMEVSSGGSQASIDLDTAALERAMGYKGKASGGVYRFSIPRAEPVSAHGLDVPDAMGTAIAINFQPTGDGKAAITGDFVLTAEEVNPVLRTLRANGIEVTALHNHMLTEEPRLFFMHFWANDDALTLARGLKAALDKINIERG